MIYLDYQSTTPVAPEVLESMLPYFRDNYANAHSNHFLGIKTSDAVEKSRAEIAQLIGASPKEIIFTSGATEANNLALIGCFNYYKNKKKHIITSMIEHKSVLACLRYLETKCGARVTYLKPDDSGLISPSDVADAIDNDTLMITVMSVNNEIGTIQPIDEIGTIARDHNVFFHCDAAQSLGKLVTNVKTSNVDMMSLSAHKIYGPKGIGALYVSTTPTRIRLTPLIHGGGQERNLRSGTLPVPLCVGFGAACEIAGKNLALDNFNAVKLRDLFLKIISTKTDNFTINGSMDKRVAQNLNISFYGVESESLIYTIDDIAITSTSACSSAKLEESYVLSAINTPAELSHSAIRISFGRYTTDADVVYAATKIADSVELLRKISPLK